jgi:uncharacterized membrane protein YvbJ
MMKRLFICEKCGRPVPARSKRCAHCGKIFDGVKCPRCGFTGDQELFESGCPICGYSGESALNRNISKQKKEPGSGDAFSFHRNKREKKMLSLFVYRVIGIVVLILIVVFIIVLFRNYS